MLDEKSAWKIEEVCLNAWPAIRMVHHDEFLLRFADGYRRRSNSINPTSSRILDLEKKVENCVAAYQGSGLPAIFRVQTISDPQLDLFLEQNGYAREGETMTLAGSIDKMSFAPHRETQIQPNPDQAWFKVADRLSERTAKQRLSYRQILEHLATPTAFAVQRQEGQVVAVGFATLHDGHVCFESIATDAKERGRGHAQALMGSLIEWGRGQGASIACLQVEADNPPAIALYRKLGFAHEVYRYHYRRPPQGGDVKL